MSQIDWSKAPEDATHHGRGEDCCYWAKCIGDQQYFINIARWDNGKWKEVTERYDEAFLTSRPKSEWTGEGLPPVGVRIEAKHKNAQADWARPGFYETEIVAIGKQLVIFEADGSGHEKVGRLADYIFRPIRTPEQIAAEQRRKSAIALYEAVMNFGNLAFDRLPLDRQEHYLKPVDAGWQQVKP